MKSPFQAQSGCQMLTENFRRIILNKTDVESEL